MTIQTTDASAKSMPRAKKRPSSAVAPAHWQASTAPVPCIATIIAAEDQPGGRDPVRYGDWEYKGLAIDF